MSQKRKVTVNDCSDCGVCCLHMGYPPYVGGPPFEAGEPREHATPEPAWREMPEPLRAELLAYIDQYQPPESDIDGPCVWYNQETRLCKHHHHRPSVCRDFQAGSRGCLSWRDVYEIETP
ncbi:Flagellin N-methylase [Rubripirellula amarantea]|uniref:Flagellin N-methylase n=1 Tax=Rubripirellula amarantea TaxID=2527999 RepID=A0A5C5WUE0_9BACT|nr:YkgJ family cysteine cluster protein [Rubripirellula amarantea]TWT53849.1 Flagellin N-methylase [Rubripirellula amarantea]